MKKSSSKLLLVVVASLLLFSFNSYAQDKVETKECKIKTNAYSYMCKDRIENLIKDLKGVSEAYLSMDDRVITINYDDNQIKTDDFVQKIKEIGYEAEIMPDMPTTATKEPKKQLIN